MEFTQVAPTEEAKQSVIPASYKISTTLEGMSVLIPLEAVQRALQEYTDSLLNEKSHYNNPVKKVIDNMFSSYNSSESNKELKAHFDTLIANQMKAYMATPSFQLQLGQAMAEEMARRAVDKLMPTK